MYKVTPADADRLRERLPAWEDALVDALLRDAIARGYVRYSSTLREAWLLSVRGLTDAILALLDRSHETPELHPDEDLSADPACAFGVNEARLHRSRGVNLQMFLGLFKYYREAYAASVGAAAWEEPDTALRFVRRALDRVEIAYVTEWAGTSAETQLGELSSRNRDATNLKNQYLTVFESLGTAVAILDTEARVTELNLAARRALLGAARVGDGHYPKPTLPELPWLSAWVREVAAGGEEGREVRRVETVDGPRMFRLHAEALLDVSSRFQGWVVQMHDVTDLVEARREGERRTRELQAVHAASPAALFVVERRGMGAPHAPCDGTCLRVVEANAAAAALIGVADPQEVLGPFDLIATEASGRLAEVVLDALDDATPGHVSALRAHRRDGAGIHLDVWVAPTDSSEGPSRAVVFMQDVTARHAAERELRRAAAFFDNTRDGVVITDSNGEIVDANRAFETITGWSRAEAIGRSPRMLKSGHHDAAFYAEMWRRLREEGHWQGEVWNRRRNGSLYPEWLSIAAVRDEAGAIANYVGVFSDITRLKETEARLRHLAHHDPLTGLPNRLHYTARVAHACERADRDGTRAALMLMDLDGFKAINDTWGHAVGDRLLVEVARRMRAHVRAVDTVARIGGDEFVIVTEGMAGPEDVEPFLERLLPVLREPVDLGVTTVRPSISLGLAVYPDDARSADELYKRADAAMYTAKREQLGWTAWSRTAPRAAP